MSKSIGTKLFYSCLVAVLLTFSATAAFAQLAETPTGEPATATPAPVDTATPVPPTAVPATPVPTPVPPTPVPVSEPVQIPEPITVVLFGTGLAALSASVAKRRKGE